MMESYIHYFTTIAAAGVTLATRAWRRAVQLPRRNRGA